MTAFQKLSQLGQEVYMYSTDTEDLMFIELGESTPDQSKPQIKQYYQSKGKFNREKYSKINCLVQDQQRNLIFMLTDKNTIEVLRVMSEAEVVKKYKRKLKRQREKESGEKD